MHKYVSIHHIYFMDQLHIYYSASNYFYKSVNLEIRNVCQFLYFVFLLLQIFCFFSSYNPLNSVILRHIKNQTNIREQDKSPQIRCNSITTGKMYSFQLTGVYRNQKNTISKKLPLIVNLCIIYYRPVQHREIPEMKLLYIHIYHT